MIQTFPQTNPQQIDGLLSEVTNLHDPHVLMNLYDILSEPNIQGFSDALISACINLQGNKIYRNSSEDDRNTFIANLLDAGGYFTKDQTRWSQSYVGKSSGEIDIFVYKKDGSVFTIIEALNLTSVDKKYISKHLEKIFTYDTTGFRHNYIIVYSSAKDFSRLWTGYIDYIPSVNYRYKYIDFIEIMDYEFTDIKIGKTSHNRNDEEVYLFHIVVNMSLS